MSHPVIWRAKTFFYPFGNTPAVCLTQDLPPGQPADILLLGCGDPRNILYTLFADLRLGSERRKLDFTCCDIEPAVLARNVILFALLAAQEPMDQIWNIFYHFVFDKASSDLLTRYTKLLIDASKDLKRWQDSTYGSWIKFSGRETLAELRRHWLHYAMFPLMPQKRKDELRAQFDTLSAKNGQKGTSYLSVARSAGPLWIQAEKTGTKSYRLFWDSGTTFRSMKDVRAAKLLNPTFLYCISGERFDPHYGTSPAMGFHLATAFTPLVIDPLSQTSEDRIKLAETIKKQFQGWCAAFQEHLTDNMQKITIRFHAGDAISFCSALRHYARTGNPVPGIFTAPWRGSQIELDGYAQASPPGPLAYDVIDSSNLTDHIGLYNVLISARPLLKEKPTSPSVLYTEAMLAQGNKAANSLLDRLGQDLPTVAIMFDLVPRPFLSTFTGQSNLHELFMQSTPQDSSQFHERVPWVIPNSGDVSNPGHHSHHRIAFDAKQLSSLLFEMYDQLLRHEHTLNPFTGPMLSLADIQTISKDNYHRQTFAIFLCLIKDRVDVIGGTWADVFQELVSLAWSDKKRLLATNFYQDLCVQLHLYGLHTVEGLLQHWRSIPWVPKNDSPVFRGWNTIPPLVCVVLRVPSDKLSALDGIGTPGFCAGLLTPNDDNAFSGLHVVPGQLSSSDATGKVVLTETRAGPHGAADLIFSFWVPSWILLLSKTRVGLRVRCSPITAHLLTPKLGLRLTVFEADLCDRKYVQVLRERPGLPTELERRRLDSIPQETVQTIRFTTTMTAWLDVHRSTILGITGRIEFDESPERTILERGDPVSIQQRSSCTIAVSIGSKAVEIRFPYPINGTQTKLRIARKSHYVELVAAIHGPMGPGGYAVNEFPIINYNDPVPWSLHHLSLDKLPALDLKESAKLGTWLGPHLGCQVSDRERAIVNALSADDDAPQVLSNVKRSLHTILMYVGGIPTRGQTGSQKPVRTIGLTEPQRGGVYALIFVNQLRLDLASFTVVLDAAILPLSEATVLSFARGLGVLMNSGPLVQVPTRGTEAAAWKRFMVTCVERCRTWSHKPGCEYLKQGKAPLSTEVMEMPLCSCGKGIAIPEDMLRVPEWKLLLPSATRAAISPLFSVSYLEQVLGDIEKIWKEKSQSTQPKCASCGSKPGTTGKLRVCGACKKVQYCSEACQKAHWKSHKKTCKESASAG